MDGLKPQSESPKSKFELACERDGLDHDKLFGVWSTYSEMHVNQYRPIMLQEQDELFSTPNWLERIEQTLVRDFIKYKKEMIGLARSSFRSLPSITALGLEEIRAIVKSQKLLDWIGEFDGNSGALLVGATATGKTLSVYGACIAVAESLQQPDNSVLCSRELRTPQMMRVPREWPFPASLRIHVTNARRLGQVRDCAKLGEEEPEEISRARNATIIFIDDIGWERAHQRQVISDILASRYDAGLATVATSGLSLTELRTNYGDAVMRRMIETSGKRGAIIEV